MSRVGSHKFLPETLAFILTSPEGADRFAVQLNAKTISPNPKGPYTQHLSTLGSSTSNSSTDSG